MALQTGLFSDLIASERQQLLIERAVEVGRREEVERRSSLENPQTPLSYPAEWLLDIFNGGRTDSGIRVSELTAFQVVTFLSCVDLIAGKIASLPAHVYERSFSKTGRTIHRVAYDHDYYDLVHTEANPEMTRSTFLKVFLLHALAWPGGYAEIQRDAGNTAVAFWPRNPAKTRPIRLSAFVRLEPTPWRPFAVSLPAGTLCYATTDGVEELDGSEPGGAAAAGRLIPASEMLHIPGLSFDGRIGQGVVWLARQTLGLAIATERFGAKYFANFAKPGGVLETTANTKAEDRDRSKQSWREAQGGENAHQVTVLPPGWKFTAMSHNPEEAQTIETRGFLRTEIASLFHVPVRMIGDTSTKTRGSSEQENQELLDYTLSPWMEAIKQEWKRKLFPHSRIGRTPKNPFFVDFDTWDMLRPDAASREKFNASGKQWGYLNTNDIRGKEKMAPVEEEWAEKYWMPVNMTLVDTPIDPTHQDGSGKGEIGPARSYFGLFHDAIGRYLSRSRRDYESLSRCFRPLLEVLCERLEDPERRRSFVSECLEGMNRRSANWSEESIGEIADEEMRRALIVATKGEIRAGNSIV